MAESIDPKGLPQGGHEHIWSAHGFCMWGTCGARNPEVFRLPEPVTTRVGEWATD